MLICLLNKKTLFCFILILCVQLSLGQDKMTYTVQLEIYYTAFGNMLNNDIPKLLLRSHSKEKIKVGDKVYLEIHSSKNDCEPKICLTHPQNTNAYILGEVIGSDNDYMFIKPKIDVVTLKKEDNHLLTYQKDKTHILRLHFRCENKDLKFWEYTYHETINRKPFFFK